MRYTIELEPEQLDAIVVGELESTLVDFKEMLDARRTGEETIGIFWHDVEADCDTIEDHISAFEMILKYYKGTDVLF